MKKFNTGDTVKVKGANGKLVKAEIIFVYNKYVQHENQNTHEVFQDTTRHYVVRVCDKNLLMSENGNLTDYIDCTDIKFF